MDNTEVMGGGAFRGRAAIAVALLMAAAGCSGSGGSPLFRRHTLVFGGTTRTWYEHRPPGLAQRRAPVLVMLHGFRERATDLPVTTGVLAEADRDGFAVAAPEGLGRSWDTGGCCGTGSARRVDDVGFLAALIGRLGQTGVADPARVYLAGFSNGAMMTYNFACSRPDLLAGALVVEGTLTTPCENHRALDLMVIHQTADSIVPFNGSLKPPSSLGATSPFPSVLSSLSAWLTASGCVARLRGFRPPTAAKSVARAPLSCPGGTTTELVAIAGGTHVWPRTRSLDATTELVRFFGL
jgi:polyhydroxybutyrate depolymerase